MKDIDYYSSMLYGVDNNCETNIEKYDRVINSPMGIIGLKICADKNLGNYYEIYLNNRYIDDASLNINDEQVKALIEKIL